MYEMKRVGGREGGKRNLVLEHEGVSARGTFGGSGEGGGVWWVSGTVHERKKWRSRGLHITENLQVTGHGK